jgi:uncharacterized repeat protein (TIGR03803 family)
LRFGLRKNICFLFAICIAATTGAIAQSSTATFTTLLSFDGANGFTPSYQPLTQGTDGNLYGVAVGFANLASGTEFIKLTPAGAITPLATIDDSGVVMSALATDGNFYGTNSEGGAQYGGSVFQMTAGGQLTTIYDGFCLYTCSGPGDPESGVIQGSDGNFYGTTFQGHSANGLVFPTGAVFKVTAAGMLTTLYTFSTGIVSGPLVEGLDGNLYGIDSVRNGAVFRLTPNGQFRALHSFCMLAHCADGATPQGLSLGPDGNFYGETLYGGDPGLCPWTAEGWGGVRGVSGCGTIFRMSPQGKFTTIYAFCVHHCQDRLGNGQMPISGLTLGSDGNLYGTTAGGGANNIGTIFRVTLDGTLTTLYSFEASDGMYPSAMVQATNGIFYGAMEESEGYACCGSVFSLSVGLPPFVKTVPTIGNAGATVIILGNNLTSASSVTFNSIPAAFTVVSDTEITATVPTSATTGTVEVTTSNGTLKSNVPFQVGLAKTIAGHGWNEAQN